ncbi:H-type small acid-soluble spore protein [Aquibacillus sediminis]|uniref:H-type small acid-soluble spore protein n=1 Tax=Aquibacillus sediminis TaxID=2574734 RepID=UPI001109F3A2|nr:H-type small acid-soluble spore protein [Aquibacillus sediminis]
MDPQRAREIVDFPIMVNVTYDGQPIYIQHIDEYNQTATVFPIDQPHNEVNVSLEQLDEDDKQIHKYS